MKPSLAKGVLASMFMAGLPVLVTGAPGIGKTDVIETARMSIDADLILSHPAVADPTDAKGLPWPDIDAGIAKFLPFGDLARAMKATRPTVWFFDDLGQASPAVQAAYMQLFLARRVNDHVLPNCVTFAAATNRRKDRAGVAGLLEPVKSRFVSIFELEPDLNDWCVWAMTHNMPAALIAFMRFRCGKDLNMLNFFEPTQELTNSRSPRTWANLGKMSHVPLPEEALLEMYTGAVGSEGATEYLGFLKLIKDCPNPDSVLLTPQSAPIPTNSSTLFALSSALVARVTPQSFGRFAIYAQRLLETGNGEYAALMLQDAIRSVPAVQDTPEFAQVIVTELGQTLN